MPTEKSNTSATENIPKTPLIMGYLNSPAELLNETKEFVYH